MILLIEKKLWLFFESVERILVPYLVWKKSFVITTKSQPPPFFNFFDIIANFKTFLLPVLVYNLYCLNEKLTSVEGKEGPRSSGDVVTEEKVRQQHTLTILGIKPSRRTTHLNMKTHPSSDGEQRTLRTVK